MWCALLSIFGWCLAAPGKPALLAAELNAPGDTVRIIYSVPAPNVIDGRGPVTSFNVGVQRNVPTPVTQFGPKNILATKTQDTILVPTGTTLSIGGTASGTICAQSVRRALTSSTKCSNWQVVFNDAPPPPPDTVIVQPSTTVVGIDLKPDTITLAFGGSTSFCGFVKFADGKVAHRQTEPDCLGQYTAAYPPSTRDISPAQQQVADAVCLTWFLEDPGATLVPGAACDNVAPRS